MKNKELKEEVELLERKVKLLREYIEIRQLAEKYETKRIHYIPIWPPYPRYPNTPTYPTYPGIPWTTCGIGTGDYLVDEKH